jgi:3-hydroxybutyryl-CoA dehydratase
MDFDQITVGLRATWQKRITEADVLQYAAITGDHNPVHVDADAAARGPYGERIAHGMLSAGLLSAAMANGVPGPGAVYLSQSLSFKRPVRLGDVITAEVEVLEIKPRTRRVRLATRCRNQADELVLDGEAMVMLPTAATSDSGPDAA